MKEKSKINIFSTAIKIWLCELLSMLIFIAIAISIILFSTNILKIDLLTSYSSYTVLFILVLSYIGILVGAYNSFKRLSKSKQYIPKSLKFVVLLFQIIFFAIFTYISILIKLPVKFFIGIYLTIFIEYIFNSLYTYLNNKKYSKEKKVSNKKNSNNDINNKDINNMIIKNIDELK